MNLTEMLLTVLVEECAETAQRASKAIRFTLEEIQEGQEQTNAERLVLEFNDIVAVMESLHELGIIPQPSNSHHVKAKKEKLEKWLAYSMEVGALKNK